MLDTVYLFELSVSQLSQKQSRKNNLYNKKKSLSTLASVGCTFHIFLLFEKNIILKADDPNFPDQEAEINMTS